MVVALARDTHFRLEITDEQGQQMIDSLCLADITVMPHQRIGYHIWRAQLPPSRHGKLRAKFVTDERTIRTLCPETHQNVQQYRPTTMNLRVFRDPNVHNFNSYTGCFLTSIEWIHLIDDLFEVEAEWYYHESEVNLNDPMETFETIMRTSEEIIGTLLRTRRIRPNGWGLPIEEDELSRDNSISISTVDWRKIGF